MIFTQKNSEDIKMYILERVLPPPLFIRDKRDSIFFSVSPSEKFTIDIKIAHKKFHPRLIPSYADKGALNLT